MAEAERFGAFISYSHKDDAVAKWLHGKLEAYRTPKPLIGGEGAWGPIPARVGKVFRDREEFAAGSELKDAIREALDKAECLIVLCSPNSAASQYVPVEIEHFKARGLGHRIIPVILDGEPPECFPAPLRDGRERIGADFRAGKDGRDHGLTKVLAGVLGVGLDDLVQRERVAQRWRMRAIGGLAAVFALLAVAATWFGVQSRILQHRAEQAALQDHARAGAERAINLLDPEDRFLNWTQLEGEGPNDGAAPDFGAPIQAVLEGLEGFADLEKLPGRAKEALDLVWRRTSPALATWRKDGEGGIASLEWARKSGKLLVVDDDTVEVWDAAGKPLSAMTGLREKGLLGTGEVWLRRGAPQTFARWCGNNVMLAVDGEKGLEFPLLDPVSGTLTKALAGPRGAVARCSPNGAMVLAVHGAKAEASMADRAEAMYGGPTPERSLDFGPQWDVVLAQMPGLKGEAPAAKWVERYPAKGAFIDVTWSHDGSWAAIVGETGAYIVSLEKNLVMPFDGRFLGWERNALRFAALRGSQLMTFRKDREYWAEEFPQRSRVRTYFDETRFLDLKSEGQDWLSQTVQVSGVSGLEKDANLNAIIFSPDLMEAMFLRGLCDRGNGPGICREVSMRAYDVGFNLEGVFDGKALLEIARPHELYLGHEAPATALAWAPDGKSFITGAHSVRITGGNLTDPTLRLWRAPNPPTDPKQGGSFARVDLTSLCERTSKANPVVDNLEPTPFEGSVCAWNSGTRGGSASQALNAWVTTMRWTPNGAGIELGFTDGDCNACVYGPMVKAAVYNLANATWSAPKPAKQPEQLTLAMVIGPDPLKKDRTLDFRPKADCAVAPPDPEADNEPWWGGAMHASGIINSYRFVCILTKNNKKPIALAHDGPVNSMRWSPDGAFVLTASDDGYARIFDSRTGALVRSFEIDAAATQDDRLVLAAEWSPDQRHVALLGPAGLVLRPVAVASTAGALRTRLTALRTRGPMPW